MYKNKASKKPLQKKTETKLKFDVLCLLAEYQ